MKVLVFSDSHSDVGAMLAVCRRRAGDAELVIHAGDLRSDAVMLADDISVPVVSVVGNCDIDRPEERFRVLELCGHRIFLTHGHFYGVGGGFSSLSAAAKARGCSFVVFGHTHEPYDGADYGVRMFNPGSISRPRGGFREGSFGVLDIYPKEIRSHIFFAEEA